jgi:hypothetical protein
MSKPLIGSLLLDDATMLNHLALVISKNCIETTIKDYKYEQDQEITVERNLITLGMNVKRSLFLSVIIVGDDV